MKYLASTLWLTGLSAAGRTTLAHALADTLTGAGMTCDDGSNETGAEYPHRDSGHNAVTIRNLREFSAGATDGPAYTVCDGS
jgi:hypothetical protein